MRSLTLLCLSLAVTVLAQEEPQSSPRKVQSPAPNQVFHDLLNILPEESIQAALHNHFQTKFKAGVFQFNRKAVEAVHSTDPPLATKLVIDAVKHGLVRRQNNTTPRTSPTPTVPTPIPTTSLPGPGSSDTGIIGTGTDSLGSTFITTTPASTPAAESSLILEPTTLPDGTIVTLTRFVSGNPSRTGPSPNQPAPTADTTPGLQNAASRNTHLALGAAIVAVGSLVTAMFI